MGIGGALGISMLVQAVLLATPIGLSGGASSASLCSADHVEFRDMVLGKRELRAARSRAGGDRLHTLPNESRWPSTAAGTGVRPVLMLGTAARSGRRGATLVVVVVELMAVGEAGWLKRMLGSDNTDTTDEGVTGVRRDGMGKSEMAGELGSGKPGVEGERGKKPGEEGDGE